MQEVRTIIVFILAVLMAPSMSTAAETGAGSAPAAQPPSKQQIESAQATMEKARQNLASRRNDPCYPVLLEKEFARLQFGSKLPWVTCTEVRFDVTWELADTWTRHSGWPQDAARYRLHETYPGYAKVVYDDDRRSLVRQMRVEGPSGGPVRAELEAMSAVLLVKAPKGKPRLPDLSGLTSTDPNQVSRAVIKLVTTVLGSGGSRYASVQTNRTDVFAVNADTARFQFQASSDYSVENRFLSQTLEMNPAQVNAVENRLVAPPGRLVDHEVPYMPPVNMVSDLEGKQLTVDDVMKSLSRGVLEKSYPVRHEMHPLPAWGTDQRGKVTVRMTVGAPPKLLVSPASGLKSSGPTVEKKFEPPHKDYVLQNPGKIPLRFAVNPDKPWLRATPGTGEIPAGTSQRVRVSVEQGAAAKLTEGKHTAAIAFRNTSSGEGDTTRPAELEVGPEQLWRVVLKGHRFVRHREVVGILDPDAGGRYINYFHGMKFEYSMAAEFVIRKSDKHWLYKSGRITDANVTAAYHQQPELYKVVRQSCTTCGVIRRLKGQPINGTVQDDTSVILYWPGKAPSAEIDARLQMECRPGPTYETCMGQKKQGTTYSMQDDDFLQRADGHVLPLRNGAYHPKYEATRTGTGELLIDHRYEITRLK